MFDDVDRDIAAIRLPRWGRVVRVDGPARWLVVDDEALPVEPIRRYLTNFAARDTSKGSVRSYAYVLMRWWHWLRAVDVEWDKATPVGFDRDGHVLAAVAMASAQTLRKSQQFLDSGGRCRHPCVGDHRAGLVDDGEIIVMFGPVDSRPEARHHALPSGPVARR